MENNEIIKFCDWLKREKQIETVTTNEVRAYYDEFLLSKQNNINKVVESDIIKVDEQ